MKKRSMILLSIIVVVLIAYVAYYQISPIKNSIYGAAALTVSKEEELAANSQLIMVVTMINNVKSEIMHDSVHGLPYFGFTKTAFHVDKILKGEYHDNTISVNEPYFSYTNEIAQKTITYIDDYVPTKKGSQYILYLTTYEGYSDYFLTANYQGKYPLLNTGMGTLSFTSLNPAQIEISKTNYDSSYSTLYRDVIEKYGNFSNSN